MLPNMFGAYSPLKLHIDLQAVQVLRPGSIPGDLQGTFVKNSKEMYEPIVYVAGSLHQVA